MFLCLNINCEYLHFKLPLYFTILKQSYDSLFESKKEQETKGIGNHTIIHPHFKRSLYIVMCFYMQAIAHSFSIAPISFVWKSTTHFS